YEYKWAALRAGKGPGALRFVEFPWPVFKGAARLEDITHARVQEFVCSSLREAAQGASQAKVIRSEMLRWHPDKFNARVLKLVAEVDRAAVAEAAGHVARILNELNTGA
ncbi:hypothetical protein BC834DRAFT_827973, partial [Gloeopeniophorella convolvens]